MHITSNACFLEQPLDLDQETSKGDLHFMCQEETLFELSGTLDDEKQLTWSNQHNNCLALLLSHSWSHTIGKHYTLLSHQPTHQL